MTLEAPAIDLDVHGRAAGRTRTVQSALGGDIEAVMSDRLALPDVSHEVGTHQRQQLRVPTCETPDGSVMSVGRRQDGRGYDGFGLTTIAHVAVSAEGGKAESTMTLQSNGQLLVQSDTDSAYVVSKGPAVFASESVANITATGGVVIAAGGAVPVANARIEGAEPAAPAALGSYTELMDTAADAWDTFSEGNEGSIDARDSLQDEADPDHKTEWAGHQGDVGGKDLAAAAHGGNNALGDEGTSEGGGVSIWGEAGFLVGTLEFGAIHAEKALTISSEFAAIAASDALDLSAQKDVMMTAGGNLGIIAADALRVVSNADDVHIATRTGDKVEVMAKAVHLGELEPDDPQEETTLVSARAKERISLMTDNDGFRDEGDEGIFLQTHEVIEGIADATITLEAGDTITLKIAGEDIQVIVDSGGVLTIQSDGTTLEISDDDGLVFGDDSDDYLTASSDGIFAGVDSDNCIEISSSEVTIKGSSIEIG